MAQVVVTPDPIPEDIRKSGLAVDVEPFVTIPPSKATLPLANINTVYHADDGSGRLFTNDSRGKIWLIDEGQLDPQPFLDITNLAGFFATAQAAGLRSFAFHPDFENSGTAGFRKVYTVSTHTTANPEGTPVLQSPNGEIGLHNVVIEWQVSATDPTIINPASKREVVRIADRTDSHNADQLLFNPNAQPGDDDYGLMYIGTGDGGGGAEVADPEGNAQNPLSPLGKVLRIDPLRLSNGESYRVPDNPFVGNAKFLPEIWALGFRHPQNLSFDTGGRGQFFIADIGEANIEEVNLGVAGANYGWADREGTFATVRTARRDLLSLPDNDDAFGFTYPVAQYDHTEGQPGSSIAAITGGFVYRGNNIPDLVGQYLFGDISVGRIFHIPVSGVVLGQQIPVQELTLFNNGVEKTFLQIIEKNRADLRFGQDEDGELYISSKRNGVIYKLGPADGSPGGGGTGGGGTPTTVATNGDDYLVFGSGNDVIKALAGNDTIDSGGGQDTITGGPGADIFILRANQQRDVINDFVRGSDLIKLEGLGLDQIELKPTSGGTNIRQGALTLASVKGVTLSAADILAGGGGTGGGPEEPGTLSIAALDADKDEGNDGITAFSFRISRADFGFGGLSVAYAVNGSGGNPASSGDFAGGVFPSGIVDFDAGQSVQTVSVNVVGDTDVEADEGFTVTLSNPSGGATITQATATGIIRDDDGTGGGGTGGGGTGTTVATNGDDYLVFGSGNDVIKALAGNDTIDSGGGQDTVTGGLGADIFILRAGQPRDVINDFVRGSDLIQLDGLGLDEIELKPTSGGTNVKQGALTLASVKGVTLSMADIVDSSPTTTLLALDGEDMQQLLL